MSVLLKKHSKSMKYEANFKIPCSKSRFVFCAVTETNSSTKIQKMMIFTDFLCGSATLALILCSIPLGGPPKTRFLLERPPKA